MKRILSTLLLLGLLAGCASTGGGDAAKVPMGRYVEEEVQRLENIGQLMGFRPDGAGGAIFYASTTEHDTTKYLRYTLSGADGALSSTEPEWLRGLAGEGGILLYLSEGEDGLVYALTTGDDGNHIFRTRDGVTAEEVLLPQTKEEVPPGDSVSAFGERGVSVDVGAAFEGDVDAPQVRVSYPLKIFTAEDGSFVVLYMDGTAIRYSEEGTELAKFSGANYSRNTALLGNELVMGGSDGKELWIYDLEKAEQTGSCTYDNLTGMTVVGMDGLGIYLADATGIYRQNRDGTLWERLVEGDLTSLSMPDRTLTALCGDGGDGFWGVLQGEDACTLVRYVYSSDIPTNPDTELTIFGLTDNATVRQTIGEFQRRNPTVRVNFRVAQSDGSSATTEDLIRALNTELLSGKAPDLLLLDGLPVESYIDKGVLLDLTDLVGEWQNALGLLDNLLGAYEKDGKRYGVPSRFGVPIMVGEGEAVDQTRSILDLLNQVEARQKETVPFLYVPSALWEDMGIMLSYYDVCSGAWSGANRALDQDALTAYLADMLSLNTVLRRDTPELDSSMAATVSVSVTSIGGSGFETMDLGAVTALQEGNARFHLQNLSGFLNLKMLANAVVRNEGYTLAPLFGGDSYVPMGGIGITSAGAHQDLAKAFLELMLTETVQGKYLYDGFPVNGQSLDKLMVSALDGAADAGFAALCRTLKTPVVVDQVVKDAVSQELKGLLDGTVTPQQAAENVVKNTELYRTE